MRAELHCIEGYKPEMDQSTIHEIQALLAENKIVHGIDNANIEKLIHHDKGIEFPLLIAEGTYPEHGQDGVITYTYQIDKDMKKGENWNFREVMQIPSVKKGQKLATITPPTNGKPGENIFGDTVSQKKGTPVSKKPGKNVVYSKSERTFYADADGEISLTEHYIHIHSLYEIHETISMKVGNVDFVGSITIHGDVPSGYTIKAGGDIKIFGMVEAATIISGGSITISEGLSGMKKGNLHAKENIYVGYINQGIAHAGNNLYVENSILHSECFAKKQVFCQKGNIIGGATSAGRAIEAKDIGNRMNTKTELYFGIEKDKLQQEKKLRSEKEKLEDTLRKLALIKEKLATNIEKMQDPKIRITMLRQRHSWEKAREQLAGVEEELRQLNNENNHLDLAKLLVNHALYPNTMVTFGKYKRLILQDHKQVKVSLRNNEIIVQSLSS